jgi:hypothetical protein
MGGRKSSYLTAARFQVKKKKRHGLELGQWSENEEVGKNAADVRELVAVVCFLLLLCFGLFLICVLYSGLHACSAGTLPLEPSPHLFFALVIFQVGSCVFLSGPGWTKILLFTPPCPS